MMETTQAPIPLLKMPAIYLPVPLYGGTPRALLQLNNGQQLSKNITLMALWLILLNIKGFISQIVAHSRMQKENYSTHFF